MPTYEYRCAKGHEFEKFQRMSDEPLEECPECGAAAERLLSVGGGLLFRGSGFYETDYRSESYRNAAEAETKSGADESGESAGDAGKGAGKPEKASAASGSGGKAGGAAGGSGSSSRGPDAGSTSGSGGSGGSGERSGGSATGPAND